MKNIDQETPVLLTYDLLREELHQHGLNGQSPSVAISIDIEGERVAVKKSSLENDEQRDPIRAVLQKYGYVILIPIPDHKERITYIQGEFHPEHMAKLPRPYVKVRRNL